MFEACAGPHVPFPACAPWLPTPHSLARLGDPRAEVPVGDLGRSHPPPAGKREDREAQTVGALAGSLPCRVQAAGDQLVLALPEVSVAGGWAKAGWLTGTGWGGLIEQLSRRQLVRSCAILTGQDLGTVLADSFAGTNLGWQLAHCGIAGDQALLRATIDPALAAVRSGFLLACRRPALPALIRAVERRTGFNLVYVGQACALAKRGAGAGILNCNCG